MTALVGVALRTTMDIDTSIKNQSLSLDDAKRIVDEIGHIDLDDGVSFEGKDAFRIMNEMEYPGIRLTMNARMGKLITPLKIDISTGDAITPGVIEYRYKMLLSDKFVTLWAYNLETVLAEKIQTILARGLLNTRMRDFYDIRILLSIYAKEINGQILKKAFNATCKNRGTENLSVDALKILAVIHDDGRLRALWKTYQDKYSYASDISYGDIMESVEFLLGEILMYERNK